MDKRALKKRILETWQDSYSCCNPEISGLNLPFESVVDTENETKATMCEYDFMQLSNDSRIESDEVTFEDIEETSLTGAEFILFAEGTPLEHYSLTTYQDFDFRQLTEGSNINFLESFNNSQQLAFNESNGRYISVEEDKFCQEILQDMSLINNNSSKRNECEDYTIEDNRRHSSSGGIARQLLDDTVEKLRINLSQSPSPYRINAKNIRGKDIFGKSADDVFEKHLERNFKLQMTGDNDILYQNLPLQRELMNSNNKAMTGIKSFENITYEDYIIIGPNGTKVRADIFHSIDWSNEKMAVRPLLRNLFDRKILGTHTLTGKPSNAFKNRPRVSRGQLDPDIITDIISIVMQKSGRPINKVKAAITSACADEAKALNRKHK